MDSKSFYDAWNDQVYLVDQAGKGFSIDSASSLGGRRDAIGITPTGYSVPSALNAIRRDETLYAAIVTKVDATLSNGWFISGSNKQQVARAERFFEQARFSSVLRHLLFNLYPYGNAFMEIVKDSPELYVVETTQVEIHDAEGHGIASGYTQQSGASEVKFTPDEIVHFRLDRFTTALWGEIPVRPLDQWIGIKLQVKNHIWRLFKNNAFRQTVLFPENTNKDDTDRSLAEFRLASKDPSRPFVWFGGVTIEALQAYQDGDKFIDTINRADSAILMQMQVPPIMAGMPDNSGRASGEQQTYKAFNTHIRSIQRNIEDTINYELMPKLGFSSVKFQFNELDRKSEKDVLDMAVQLKALGAKPDKLAEWMSAHGIDVSSDFFDPGFFMSPMDQEDEDSEDSSDDKMMRNAITNKTAPSRAGKNGKRDSVGTGSESSTKDSQIVTQSIDDVDSAFERLTNPEVKKRAKELYAEGFYYAPKDN